MLFYLRRGDGKGREAQGKEQDGEFSNEAVRFIDCFPFVQTVISIVSVDLGSTRMVEISVKKYH